MDTAKQYDDLKAWAQPTGVPFITPKIEAMNKKGQVVFIKGILVSNAGNLEVYNGTVWWGILKTETDIVDKLWMALCYKAPDADGSENISQSFQGLI
jgi:hypothetical protein